MNVFACLKKIYPDWKGVVFGNCYAGITPDESETRPTPTFAELQAVSDDTDICIEAITIRAERDVRLAESDKYALDDHPTGKKQEWLQYRENLRAVPDQPGFPFTVTWPEKPE